MPETLCIGSAKASKGQKVWGEIPVPAGFEDHLRPPLLAIVRGSSGGPTVYIGAGTHGDEFNSIEAVRRVALQLEPNAVRGTVILLPLHNRAAFEARRRHTPADGRDLDSSYPGDRAGSPTEVLAHMLFHEAMLKADCALDLHTAARGGWNLVHALTAPDTPEASVQAQQIASLFGVRVLVALESPKEGYLGQTIGWDLTHSLFVQASSKGIPCSIIEFGEGGRLEPDQVELGIQGILNVLAGLGVLDRAPVRHAIPFVAHGAVAVRCRAEGFLYHEARPGQQVRQGQVLARIVSFRDRTETVVSPCDGVVVRISTRGMATPDERVTVVARS